MIRNFNKAEVLETFIETVREKTPISLVEQTVRVELSPILHVIIEKTIEKLIRTASPNLRFSIEINPIHSIPYLLSTTVKSFEPYFGTDPGGVHFYVSRQAVPTLLDKKGSKNTILTNTNINIDYYYPAIWAMTPPRNKEMALRRTLDEILFAWTIVSKTLLAAPIVRFDDEEEAAEAVFAFANALLFTEVVVAKPYYNSDFLKRLMYIQKAIIGSQPVRNKELATIIYPPNKKIGQLEVPVVHILHNKLTQYLESYLSCHAQGRFNDYFEVLKALEFCELKKEEFGERNIVDYLYNCVGKAPSDSHYDVSNIRKLIPSDNYIGTRPPMISARFKGIFFDSICPFTHNSRSSTHIYFEKDIVSHLEKTFKHLDVEDAVDAARRMILPKSDEVNDGYDVDPSLIDPGLFNFRSKEGGPDSIERLTTRKYKNLGTYAEENLPQERPEGFMPYLEWKN